MKLAIHTISDDNNFGNRLQNFALQKVLNSRYGETQTLQELHRRTNYYSFINDIKFSKSIIPIRVLKFYLNKSEKISLSQSINLFKRQRVFRDFTKEYVPKFQTQKINEKVDCFIIGSDQIWNPNFRKELSEDFLPFFQNKNIISYAASIGLEGLNKVEAETFKVGLQNLSAISVREFSAKKILSKYTEKDITVSIDPTMLLTMEEWRGISNNANSRVKNQKKFLITYFLGEMSKSEKEYIDGYAQKHELKIINISDMNSNLYAITGPLEFLWLFDNAQAVFADSYHAAVFSLIFQKYFEIFERHDSLPQMNTRMHTLFQHFSLEDRMHNIDENRDYLPAVNYEKISEIIELKREEAFKWLDVNLKKKRS